jgi:hypothetical protein
LEKIEEGYYEITHQNTPEAQILTPEFTAGMAPPSNPALPTHEVDSYREAEGIFEELSQESQSRTAGLEMEGGNPNSHNPIGGDLEVSGGHGDESLNLDEITPGTLAIGLIILGWAFLHTFGINLNENFSLFGIGAFSGGILLMGYAGYIAWNDGISSAIGFLTTTPADSNNGSANDGTQKTPPLSQRKKTKLIHDRADRRCEFCGEKSDHLEVHHIVPRAEGGPNIARNLIVLCPEDHRKADDAVHKRDQLRYQVDNDGFEF